MLKKVLLFGLLIWAIWFGYNKFLKGKRIEDTQLAESAFNSAKKSSSITAEGKIKETSAGTFIMVTNDGTVKLDSRKIDLSDYLDKDVKVNGMYSGSTLYVDHLTVN